MRRMIDKMGFDVVEIPNIQEVIIRTDKKEIVVEKPSVSEMKAKDTTILTITSENGYSERELEVQVFPDEDIDLICEQTGVQREKAVEALTDADGDLARAILSLGG